MSSMKILLNGMETVTMGKSKLFKIALIASVALNLAAIAFFTTQWVRHSDMRARGGMMFNRHAAMSALDSPAKKEIGALWKSRKEDIRGEFRASKQSSREMAKLLSDETLDLPKIRATHEKMSAHRRGAEDILFEILLETAELMTLEERREFFKRGFHIWRHNKGQH